MNETARELDLIRTQLRAAIERDLRPHPARPLGRRTVRLALAGAVATGVALGALSLVPGQGASVVARAAAALRLDDATILHIDMAIHENGDTGSSSTFNEETWQQGSPPFAQRSVRTKNGVSIDLVTRNDGSSELYDATTNTIYAVTSGGLSVKQGQLTPPPPAAQTPAPGSEASSGAVGKPSLSPAQEPGSQMNASGVDPIQVLGILESGALSVAGHVTVDGRDALKLVSADGTVTIFVDPQTYEPILWTMASGPNGVGLTAQFDVFERVPETQTTAAVFDLQAQHPGARVDTSPADYAAALQRLSGQV